MKHSFFLVIPKQQTNPQRLKEFNEKILEQWISELPIANPLLASRLVFDYITELNAIKLPTQLRLDTIEKLRPSFLTIEEYLRSRLVKTDFPKEESEKKALRFLVSIEKELTLSYWIALKDLTGHSGSWFQGKNTVLAMQRCMKGLSDIVKSHLIMGMPIPDWIWMDLNSLYKLSIKLKKNTTQVAANDIVNPDNKFSSPEDVYTEIVLLFLAEASGLMQREIKLVYGFIQSVKSHVSFKNQPIPGQLFQCVILIDEDRPPFFQSETMVMPGSISIYIDFTALYKVLDERKSSLNITESRFAPLNAAGNLSEALSVELLEYLKNRWSGIPLESDALFTDRLDRCVAIGLNATYKLQKATELASDEEDLEFIAQSVSKRMLAYIFQKPGILSVGNLISFRKKDLPANNRCIGIVDKLVVEKESGKISFGISLLAAQAIAVNYFPLNVGYHEPFKKGLLYQVKNQEPKSYFITDTFMLKTGDLIRMFVEHDEFSVILKNKKNIGLGYWQFECTKAAEQKTQ